jgi:hypothetical protein
MRSDKSSARGLRQKKGNIFLNALAAWKSPLWTKE